MYNKSIIKKAFEKSNVGKIGVKITFVSKFSNDY
jgi:hypothetical protein